MPKGLKDCGTSERRRFYDLARQYKIESGTDDPTVLDNIRSAAVCQIAVERIEEAFLSGEILELDEGYSRLVRVRDRHFQAAGLATVPEPAERPGLPEYLADMRKKKRKKRNGKAKPTTRLQLLDEDDDD